MTRTGYRLPHSTKEINFHTEAPIPTKTRICNPNVCKWNNNQKNIQSTNINKTTFIYYQRTTLQLVRFLEVIFTDEIISITVETMVNCNLK